MNGVALAARLVLACVFALAGVAKLRDRAGARATLEDFGLPAALAAPGGVLLPLAELGVAVLLVLDPTAVAGAVGALVLLGAFTVAIAVNLAAGRRPDCNCFGQLHSKPVGAGTLTRNATLAILAGVVLAAGHTDAGAGALDGLGSMDTATTLAAGALALSVLTLALVTWFGLQLVRQHGRVLLRLDALDGGGSDPPAPVAPGLPVGAPAPVFELAGVDGTRVSLQELVGRGRPLALAFVDPGCQPCRSLLPDLARSDSRAQVIISRGDPVAARVLASEHELPTALLDPDGSVAASYEVNGTPAAVVIGPDGLLRSGLAAGPDAVRDLLDGLGDTPPGEAAPDVELQDLDGRPVSLRAAASGAPHLLVFWSPTCGFCRSMLDDVRALERRDDLPPLLLVATGDADANRAQGLQSRTLLDPGFAGTGDALGIGGTPSALRVDAEGRVVSELAVGVDQVLALAGGRARMDR